VRRAKPGDLIHVSDGAGRVFEARIERLTASEVEAAIVSTVEVPPPATRVSVIQGVAKGGKVDWVVTKLVELGVDEIIVFHAGRSIPRWDESKRAHLGERYSTLAYAAAKQSRRAWLPEVLGPLDMSVVLELCSRRNACLVADPDAGQTLRQGLPYEPIPDLALVVGPEGGLAPEEIRDFIGIGARPVRLGTQILRTETAALVLASVAMFHVGRLE
jgi:16S rRNA (uracil1498-N3)-methyltransferase